MDVLNLIQVIGSLLGTLSVGGIIGSLIGLRWKSKVEKAKADQEEAKADDAEITNASNIIKIYKDALEDLKQSKKDIEDSYLTKISGYEKKLAEYEVQLQQYKDDLKVKNTLIEDITKSQLLMKLELETIHKLLDTNCKDCEFKDNCEKYKAKKFKYESSNN